MSRTAFLGQDNPAGPSFSIQFFGGWGGGVGILILPIVKTRKLRLGATEVTKLVSQDQNPGLLTPKLLLCAGHLVEKSVCHHQRILTAMYGVVFIITQSKM